MHETHVSEFVWPDGRILLEPDAMGRILVDIDVVNFGDAYDAHRGMIPPDEIRRLEISDALVDTGCSTLALHQAHVDALGLMRTGHAPTITANGRTTVSVYGGVRLFVEGRELTMDCYVVPDATPVLVGQHALEHMGFLIDMPAHRLVAKPPGGSERKPDREPVA